MATEHRDPKPTVDRLALPFLLPLAAAAATGALIVGIGEFLLAFGGSHVEILGQEIVLPVFLALGLALIVLATGAVVAAIWGRERG